MRVGRQRIGQLQGTGIANAGMLQIDHGNGRIVATYAIVQTSLRAVWIAGRESWIGSRHGSTREAVLRCNASAALEVSTDSWVGMYENLGVSRAKELFTVLRRFFVRLDHSDLIIHSTVLAHGKRSRSKRSTLLTVLM